MDGFSEGGEGEDFEPFGVDDGESVAEDVAGLKGARRGRRGRRRGRTGGGRTAADAVAPRRTDFECNCHEGDCATAL